MTITFLDVLRSFSLAVTTIPGDYGFWKPDHHINVVLPTCLEVSLLSPAASKKSMKPEGFWFLFFFLFSKPHLLQKTVAEEWVMIKIAGKLQY